jgi:isoleucyl-tRNA synthetase
MVAPPAKSHDTQDIENRILEYWQTAKTFERSMEIRKDSKPFIFLEGPPTANGMPGIHHVLARTMKDMVCRYRTMRGFLVKRKGGWDTHGLPVELGVEKQLGISSKKEIEAYGIAPFNQKCKESVFAYEKEWRRMTERMAYWVDLDDPYITLKNDYIESVWWSLKKSWDAGLLYKGYRITPYCPRCGTPLSSHEVALGYADVTESSLTVKFKRKGHDNEYILAWTTTPWTLPGNVALAVGPNIEYVKIKQKTPEGKTEYYWLAKECARQRGPDSSGALKGEFELVDSLIGMQMENWEYEPLFDTMPAEALKGRKAFFVATADFVKTEADDKEDLDREIAMETGSVDEEKNRVGKFAGTGIVHTAVMYGEDDYNLGMELGLPAYHTVGPDGKFNSCVTKWEGRFVKECDREIIEDLKSRGLLYDVFGYTHSYPFCWRCETPLLYYARDSWYIAMSTLRDRVKELNSEVHWFPEHLGKPHGRFGNFLEELKDWALSRERYWGTPLPIWSCTKSGCDNRVCLGSVKEVEERGQIKLVDLHRPFIDEVKFQCEKCGGIMVREPYLIDVWYDSGASFFAQWHYPFENYEKFHQSFPVDFISEAIDQTRGWFYSLLACSTLTQDSLCYRTCLSTGHVLDKDGQKMSKSKGNVVDPWSIFGKEGADALRWYMLSVNPAWAPKKFDRSGVVEVVKKLLGTLWNCYAFFAQYAALDNFDYPKHHLPALERGPLDRWLLSRLQRTIKEVTSEVEAYNFHRATRLLEAFVLDDLSNWYIRRSRKRFWGEEMTTDKRSGYSTLREALETVCKLSAPMMPFLTEEIYQKITAGEEVPPSVHLTDWPEHHAYLMDEALETSMANCIKLAEAGRRLRATAGDKGIKNRQPLQRAIIVAKGEFTIAGLENILKEELNIKEVEFETRLSTFQAVTVKPNHKSIGPRFKAKASAIAKAIEALTPEAAATMLEAGKILVNVDGMGQIELSTTDVLVERSAAGPYQVMETEGFAIVLDTTITEELKAEGLARELNRRVQQTRKEMGLKIDDNIRVCVQCPPIVVSTLTSWVEYLKGETRATSFELGVEPKGDKVEDWDLEDLKIKIGISVDKK